MGNTELKHTAFFKDGILSNDCCELSFRYDFYSLPQFCSYFLDRLTSELSSTDFSLGEFTYRLLTPYEQKIVILDLVGEALDTSINTLSATDVYVYFGLASMFTKRSDDEDAFGLLFVSPYYICFYLNNILIDTKVTLFLKTIHDVLAWCKQQKLLSPVDVQMFTRCKNIIYDNFLKRQGNFFGLRYIDDPSVSFNKHTLEFIGEENCVVDNFLRRGYVEDDKEEIVWKHNFLAVTKFEFSGGEIESDFDSLWNRMYLKSHNSIESCARYIN